MGSGGHNRAKDRERRLRVAAPLAWSAFLLVVAALLGACSAQATVGGVPATGVATVSGSAGVAPAGAAGVGDWEHVLQVVATLRARPPAEPLSCLLGGSAARECTINDSSWAAQVKKLGGPSLVTFNLGSRNRTLAQDVALVRALPPMQGIVYIGVNLGRFTTAPSRPVLDLPEPAASLSPYRQHQYSEGHILTVARKKALLRAWLAERYPLFRRNYASNLATLERLIVACRERGLRAVLFELPRNRAIIGHALDAPVARYSSSCRALAKKHGVPWVSLVSAAGLPNADFYDLWHLVEPGRTVWQRLLSARTVELLREYGIGGATP